MNSYLIMDDKKTIENFSNFSSYATEQKKKMEKNVVDEQEKNVKSTIQSYVKLIFSKDIITRINNQIEPQYRVIAWIIIILIALMVVYQIISKSINFVLNTTFNFFLYLIYYIFMLPIWLIKIIINIFRFLLGFRKKSST